MDDFFRAHQAVGMKIPTYFIESTAPNNVDDFDEEPPPAPPELQLIDSEVAIEQIAKVLATEAKPNLVVMVHGFNNPEPEVLKTYAAAARVIAGDEVIQKCRGLVCVGYRWPSEKMGQPFGGTWAAMPTLPTWTLYFGALVVLLSLPLFYWAWSIKAQLNDVEYFGRSTAVHILLMFGWTIAGLVLTAALLRAIVYFRDRYRASNYGVPDLIHIIRAIDGKIGEVRGRKGAVPEHADRVQLSFIGHSMGGFVVTDAIRTLSDLFITPVHTLNAYGAKASPDRQKPSPNIGHAFRLTRFVLASPDIPAETLLSARANFLASALTRFDEAYLFSSEGDAVLRQISTLANYFVYPTKSRNYGFRLGNVEILSSNFGLVGVAEDNFLSALRVGKFTLQQLYEVLEAADAARRRTSAAPASSPPAEVLLPKIFTYFDCTDYRDYDREHVDRPLLTFAKCVKRRNPAARLRWYSQLHLLWAYIVWQRPNVHGGYFDGELSQSMIYRLACLGFDETMQAFGGARALSRLCAEKQIRVLISPRLLDDKASGTPIDDLTAPLEVHAAKADGQPE